jgi:hypothetical protein
MDFNLKHSRQFPAAIVTGLTDGPVSLLKFQKTIQLTSFPRRREFSTHRDIGFRTTVENNHRRAYWIPAFAGMTTVLSRSDTCQI